MNTVENNNEIRNRLMKQLVNELPVLRARLGVTQADIAQKIGISRQTYNSIETGKRKMNWTVFVALIAVFQNNERTKEMIQKIDGFENEVEQAMDL